MESEGFDKFGLLSTTFSTFHRRTFINQEKSHLSANFVSIVWFWAYFIYKYTDKHQPHHVSKRLSRRLQPESRVSTLKISPRWRIPSWKKNQTWRRLLLVKKFDDCTRKMLRDRFEDVFSDVVVRIVALYRQLSIASFDASKRPWRNFHKAFSLHFVTSHFHCCLLSKRQSIISNSVKFSLHNFAEFSMSLTIISFRLC